MRASVGAPGRAAPRVSRSVNPADSRSRAKSADLGKRLLHVDVLIGPRDIPGVAVHAAEPLPERAHQMIQRDPVVRPHPKVQVEGQRDGLAPGVVREELGVNCRPPFWRRAVDLRGQTAHVDNGPVLPGPAPRNGVNRVSQAGCQCVHGDNPCPSCQQPAVVVGDALSQPQLARDIFLLEVEGFQRPRPDALDVPGVEELVGGFLDEVGPGSGDRPARRQDAAVAVLHAVAVGVREEVRDERVLGRFKGGQAPEHGVRLACDSGQVPGIGVGVGRGSLVVQRQPEGPGAAAIQEGEGAGRERGDLRRTVHQVLQVRGGEGQRHRARKELCRHTPGRTRWGIERHTDGPAIQALRPHEGRGHVDVGMARVHGEVRAVQTVTPHAIADVDGGRVFRHCPALRVRTTHDEGTSITSGGLQMSDAADEVVQRVSARGGPAHAQFQGRRRKVVEG